MTNVTVCDEGDNAMRVIVDHDTINDSQIDVGAAVELDAPLGD
ncbi:hypothetical protein [Paraburkholderia sp. SIMBA_030]